MLRLETKELARYFGPRKIFENINLDLKPGTSLAVTGPNGSGKSTLLNVLLGFLLPSKGKVTYYEDDKKLDFNEYRQTVALVAPYLSMYDVLTGEENLRFLTKINGQTLTDEKIEEALELVGLGGRGGDMVSAYSTGMKQRLKYALAYLKEPVVYFFDEPTANLDPDGKKIIFDFINARREKSILILATNEEEESRLAEQICYLGQ